MKLILWVLAVLVFLLWALIASAQLYPSHPPLLGPIQRDAYGPQIGTDGTGRPFYWQPQTPGAFQGPDITIQPQINQYGFGQSADQYGRVIQPEMAQDQRSSRGIGRNLSFGIDTGLEDE